MNSKTYKDLPKSDRNERLERLSNQALEAILPVEKFLPREDKPDKGVDSSIEVINENEEFTNFRAQIQLKGTYAQEINKDGSVSLPIETSNIRYLWNNLTSIYVLYIEPRKELRFVWLKDEVKRLNKENSNWQNQDEVTLKFLQILNNEIINQIYEQIVKEGLLHRKIKETLNASSESSSKFEVNTINLEVTDENQAKEILIAYGADLLNTGHERFVLDKFNLLSEEDKNIPQFLLLKASAKANMGAYKTALDILGSIELSETHLSEKQKIGFELIESNCKRNTGEITDEQYVETLKKTSERGILGVSDIDKFNHSRWDFLNEKDLEKRNQKFEKLKLLGNKILSEDDQSDATKSFVELVLLETEEGQLMLDYQTIMFNLILFFRHQILPEKVFSLNEWNEKNILWYQKANQLLEKNLRNPIKQADISILDVNHWFFMRNTDKIAMKYLGKDSEINNEELEDKINRIKTVIDIYEKSGSNYNIVRAKMLLAELFSFSNRFEEAEELRKKLNTISERMSYKNLREDFLIDTRFRKMVERIEPKNNQFPNLK